MPQPAIETSSLRFVSTPSSGHARSRVIGASRKRQTIGREILANLVEYGFSGPVYPVNPMAEAIHSIRCFRSIKDDPGPGRSARS